MYSHLTEKHFICVISNKSFLLCCRLVGRCSRVLIPERVLHSLKQHHEKRNDQAHPTAMFQAHHNQMRLLQQQETPTKKVVNNNNDADGDAELQLPQEWTY